MANHSSERSRVRAPEMQTFSGIELVQAPYGVLGDLCPGSARPGPARPPARGPRHLSRGGRGGARAGRRGRRERGRTGGPRPPTARQAPQAARDPGRRRRRVRQRSLRADSLSTRGAARRPAAALGQASPRPRQVEAPGERSRPRSPLPPRARQRGRNFLKGTGGQNPRPPGVAPRPPGRSPPCRREPQTSPPPTSFSLGSGGWQVLMHPASFGNLILLALITHPPTAPQRMLAGTQLLPLPAKFKERCPYPCAPPRPTRSPGACKARGCWETPAANPLTLPCN